MGSATLKAARSRTRGTDGATAFPLGVSSHPEPESRPEETPGTTMEAFGHATLRRPNRAREAPGPAPPAESATLLSRRGCKGVQGTHGVCRGVQRGVQGCAESLWGRWMCGGMCVEVGHRGHTRSADSFLRGGCGGRVGRRLQVEAQLSTSSDYTYYGYTY